MAEATKLSSSVTSSDKLPPKKLHDHLIKWLNELRQKTINIKSSLSQYLWSPNMARW